jgi:threonine dehydratase
VIPIERVLAAAARARPYLLRTPLVPVDGAMLKAESLQHTGSFKVRGFFSAALALPPDELQKGLITVSAGNAALACAYTAHQLGVRCRVVMYDTAPPPKLDGVRRWRATPLLMPREKVLEWLATEGWKKEPEHFLHPFADDELLAGQGSLGLELAEDFPELRRVVIAVGGGGLIGGTGSALKGLGRDVEVIGVQSDGYPSWPQSFEVGAPVTVKADTIADGTTAPTTQKMFDLLKSVVDRWLVVPEPRLKAAIPELAASAKLVAEGAGALAYAALEQLPPGPPTVAIVSGGNIDPKLLASLISS